MNGNWGELGGCVLGLLTGGNDLEHSMVPGVGQMLSKCWLTGLQKNLH